MFHHLVILTYCHYLEEFATDNISFTHSFAVLYLFIVHLYLYPFFFFLLISFSWLHSNIMEWFLNTQVHTFIALL
eukprot:m.25900 g.25900  ORF g.25900 m.25900 type:complete len:75 (+) comp5808_c0_seq1:1237-1461(+)